MTAAARTPDERQARFRDFERRAFNVMKLALAYPLTNSLYAQVEKDVRRAITPEARVEMMLYTDAIDIFVSGRTWVHRHGWLWRQRTRHKYLSVSVTFEPYSSSMSVWTDATAPDGIVCFR